jgi:hypothetical protein
VKGGRKRERTKPTKKTVNTSHTTKRIPSALLAWSQHHYLCSCCPPQTPTTATTTKQRHLEMPREESPRWNLPRYSYYSSLYPFHLLLLFLLFLLLLCGGVVGDGCEGPSPEALEVSTRTTPKKKKKSQAVYWLLLLVVAVLGAATSSCCSRWNACLQRGKCRERIGVSFGES